MFKDLYSGIKKNKHKRMNYLVSCLGICIFLLLSTVAFVLSPQALVPTTTTETPETDTQSPQIGTPQDVNEYISSLSIGGGLPDKNPNIVYLKGYDPNDPNDPILTLKTVDWENNSQRVYIELYNTTDDLYTVRVPIEASGITNSTGYIEFAGVTNGTWTIKVFNVFGDHRYLFKRIVIAGDTSETVRLFDWRGKFVGIGIMPAVNNKYGNLEGLYQQLTNATIMGFDVYIFICNQYYDVYNHNVTWWNEVFDAFRAQGIEVGINYHVNLNDSEGYTDRTMRYIDKSSVTNASSSSDFDITLSGYVDYGEPASADYCYTYWTVKDLTDDQILLNGTSTEQWTVNTGTGKVTIHTPTQYHNYTVYMLKYTQDILSWYDPQAQQQIIDSINTIFDNHPQVMCIMPEGMDSYLANRFKIDFHKNAQDWFVGNYSFLFPDAESSWANRSMYLDKGYFYEGAMGTPAIGDDYSTNEMNAIKSYQLQPYAYMFACWYEFSSETHAFYQSDVVDITHNHNATWLRYPGDRNFINDDSHWVHETGCDARISWGDRQFDQEALLGDYEVPYINLLMHDTYYPFENKVMKWINDSLEVCAPFSGFGASQLHSTNFWNTYTKSQLQTSMKLAGEYFKRYWSIQMQFEKYVIGDVYYGRWTSGIDAYGLGSAQHDQPFNSHSISLVLLNQTSSLLTDYLNDSLFVLMGGKPYDATRDNNWGEEQITTYLWAQLNTWVVNGGGLLLIGNATCMNEDLTFRNALLSGDFGVVYLGDIGGGTKVYNSTHWIMLTSPSVGGLSAQSYEDAWKITASGVLEFLIRDTLAYYLTIGNYTDGHVGFVSGYGYNDMFGYNNWNTATSNKYMCSEVVGRLIAWLMDQEDNYKYVHISPQRSVYIQALNNTENNGYMFNMFCWDGTSVSYTFNFNDYYEAGKNYLMFYISDYKDMTNSLFTDGGGSVIFSSGDTLTTSMRDNQQYFLIMKEFNNEPMNLLACNPDSYVNITSEVYLADILSINAIALEGSIAQFFVYTNGNTTLGVRVDGVPVSFSQVGDIVQFNVTFSSPATIQVDFGHTIPPVISSPADVTFTEGDTGYSITWTVSEAYPDTFNITRNGVVMSTGTYLDGTPFGIGLSGLSVGTYIYICGVNDTSGNSASDSVTVVVIESPPSGAPSRGQPSGAPKTPALELVTINGISIDPNELVEIATTTLNLHAFLMTYAGSSTTLQDAVVKLTFHDIVTYLTESSDYYETTLDLSLMTLQLYTNYKLTLEAKKSGYATITFVCYIVLLPPQPTGYNMTYFLIGIICFTLSVISISIYVHNKRYK